MVLGRKVIIFSILAFLLFSSLTLSGCNSEPPAKNTLQPSEMAAEKTNLDGFPPPIPHQLEGREECLVCHREGEVGKTPKTPHPDYTNCRQCHVLSQ